MTPGIRPAGPGWAGHQGPRALDSPLTAPLSLRPSLACALSSQALQCVLSPKVSHPAGPGVCPRPSESSHEAMQRSQGTQATAPPALALASHLPARLHVSLPPRGLHRGLGLTVSSS